MHYANRYPHLGVITVIFNPLRYQTRYRHFFKFKDHMLRSGVDLYTVECIFEASPDLGLPPQRFEVTQSDDPKDIQIIAPSVLWMKENLINIGAQRLPPHIRYIAWIDADVEFESLDWPARTMEALQQFPIVQLFRIGYFTGPAGKRDLLRKDYSFGYSIRHNKPIGYKSHDWYAHPGYAWAMNRHMFDAMGGLIDFCIVGSGDLHFAYALLGRMNEVLPHGLHKDYGQSGFEWGNRLAQLAGYGANVGYVNTNLFHQWHGSRESRSYVNRWSILTHFKFSPIKDLTTNNQFNVISLKRSTFDKLGLRDRINGLERAIVLYFQSRNEDKVDLHTVIHFPMLSPLQHPLRNPSRRRATIAGQRNLRRRWQPIQRGSSSGRAIHRRPRGQAFVGFETVSGSIGY